MDRFFQTLYRQCIHIVFRMTLPQHTPRRRIVHIHLLQFRFKRSYRRIHITRIEFTISFLHPIGG